MTNIEAIIADSGEYKRNIETLADYIRVLEKCLATEKKIVRKLKQRTVNFQRLRDNFRKYRKKHGPKK